MSEPHCLICWNCETKNADDDTFCLQCGKLLNNIPSDEPVDLTYKKNYSISRKELTSPEFVVAEHNHNQFILRSLLSPKAKLYVKLKYGSLYAIMTGILLYLMVFLSIMLFLPNFFHTYIFLLASVFFGFMVVGFLPFMIFSPLIEKEHFNIEIENCLQAQIVDKVQSPDVRHINWLFTTETDGEASIKYTMFFDTKTDGIINIEAQDQSNYNYQFIGSQKGSVPEISLYRDKTIVSKIILGPEYEVIEQRQFIIYERKEFQLLAQDDLQDEEVVLFFATVISNKFKARNSGRLVR